MGMNWHVLRIFGISIVLLACIFLPFLPGDYDATSITLSFMVQLLAIVGPGLVPVGFLWLLYELSRLKKIKSGLPFKDRTRAFSIIALVIAFIAGLAVTVGAFAKHHNFLGFALILLNFYLLFRFISRIGKNTTTGSDRVNPIPYYLIIIPLVLVLTRWMFLEDAVDYSRSRAIRQSQQLIQDLETHYKRTGNYPVSLLAIWPDYKTGVKGIKQYHYEPQGKAYNLYFEQFSYELSVQEVVMYNKLDEQEMTSHAQDLILLTPPELQAQRGYFEVKDLPGSHWKCFRFD